MILVIETDSVHLTHIAVRIVLDESEPKPSLSEIRDWLTRAKTELPSAVERLIISRMPKRRISDTPRG